MEMPDLNEDILEGEPNTEMLNHGEDSGSLDESALQTDEQTAAEEEEEDSKEQKLIKDDTETKIVEKEENQESQEDSELQNTGDTFQSKAAISTSLPENENEDQDEEEPAKKKIKLEEENKEILPKIEDETDQQLNQELEHESEAQTEVEPQTQFKGGEQQELNTSDKTEDEKPETPVNKENEKGNTGPDTDMLATLASAALEQDPKEKGAVAATPKSPATKSETETPKKKQEMWCNVGVFDTNTTVVFDYLATPEPNEHVDLVTATLGGRRIQLEPGTAYKFRVCAVNGCGTGPWSDVAAFKTTLPGFPGAPSAIKISKSPEGAHLTWEPPGGNSSEILEYAVYLAVRSASQGCQPVTTNQAQLAFVRVFCGPTNKCMVGTNSLQAAHIDTTTKPAIIFRIAARNSKGYGPATQVRWLQESQNGTSQNVKRALKS